MNNYRCVWNTIQPDRRTIFQRNIREIYLFYPILGKKGYNHAGFEGTIGYREKEGFSEFDQNRPAAINREMSNSW